MKCRWRLVVVCLAACPPIGVVVLAHFGAGAVAAAEDRFVPLFNGKDLSGWSGDPRLWKVVDGTIVGSTDGVKIEKNTFLSYEKEFGDFVLRAKVKLRNGNSGIQFRSEQLPDYVVAGYQADIAEATYFGMLYEEKKRGIMEYWKNMTPEQQAETQKWVRKGDWNEYEITCEGDHVKLVLNGHVTCDIQDPEGARSGIIALQLHVGPDMLVSFKDISIKELTKKTSRVDESQLLMPDADAGRRMKLGVEGARYRLPAGFSVEEVASHDLIGSVINMTFDHLGRPLIATENEGVRLLLDDDGDGTFDRVHSFSETIKRAQGLFYMAPGDLLVQSDGPDRPGLYRLVDKNGDDVADEVKQIVKAKSGGMGEHAPHAIQFGPDGYYYIMYGNHAFPDFPLSKTSPSRGMQEDFLLPRYWDARGHAKGILAPGGTIQRLSPDFKTMEQYCGGFRNAYDFSIDAIGEIFTFDSDMEWDIGTPWFRPVRVVHCVPGADYGWRSGSGKLPSYYLDTLPALDDVGRGSPVGTVIYNHTVYPERYWGAFFMGDWSRGRIRVLFPKFAGASFEGKTQDFLVGEPLNVTDLDVGPDGLIYFTLGGRDTRGGMYRIRYGDKTAKPDAPATAEDVVAYPMPRSAWGRYALAHAKKTMGRAWPRDLADIARNTGVDAGPRIAALEALQAHGPKPSLSLLKDLAGDERSDVRAMAVYLLGTYPLKKSAKPLMAALDDMDALVVRRACDSLVRAGVDVDVRFSAREELAEALFARLNDSDRFVRYAARTLIERLPREWWAERVLSDDMAKRPYGALEGLVALIHTQQGEANREAIFSKLEAYSNAAMSDETLLAYLRTLQLAYIRCGEPGGRIAASLGPKLLAKFPSSDLAVNRELQVVLAHMETPGAIDALLAYLTPDQTQEEQIHTAYCLRTIGQGWDKGRRARMIDWFDRAREMTGGASFEGFITFIWDDTLKLLPDAEKQIALARKEKAVAERAEKALALLEKIEGEQVSGASELAQMSFQEISEYLEYDPMSYPKNDNDWKATLERGERAFIKARCVNCHVFGDKGKGGGPDLSTLASRFRRADILEAIMYPSKVVSDQYVGLEVELDDFSTVVGMVVSEDETTLTLIDVNGTRVDIPKNEIVSRKEATTSTMPEGLLNTMSMSDLVALVNFLERGADAPATGAQMSAVAR